MKRALEIWQRVASLPRAELSAPHNDWTEFIGPMARDDLERAVRALPRKQAAPLRAVVERADEMFRAKTLHNPRIDPSRPWWARRWWV
ncbi:hypothetical protein [Amycolatopsis ultiminotia]|uniref:hypothetical protein n=1 Tax=Amycolatopsis ultiminotia TaxID=543629 RepID=UPI0031E9858E